MNRLKKLFIKKLDNFLDTAKIRGELKGKSEGWDMGSSGREKKTGT